LIIVLSPLELSLTEADRLAQHVNGLRQNAGGDSMGVRSGAVEGSLAGKLLVAMPGIGDPRFDQAVILMCMHTSETAMGLIINKPRAELTLGDVLGHLGIEAEPTLASRQVLAGGPVKQDRGYVLHSQDFSAEDATQTVAPGVNLTATRDVLMAMATDHPPERFVLALGHSNWGAGQLESELAGNAWLVAEPDQAIIFGEAHEGKWTSAIRLLGIEPSQIMGDSGRA
jgi:putative transcriptional regulator